MKYLKKYGKALAIFSIFIIITSFFISLFNQFNVFYSKGSDLFVFIIMIIFFGSIGFYFGKKAPSKGYLEGLKIGLILIFFLILLNTVFFQSKYSLERIIYYCVLIMSSVFSSMIGINKKG